MQHGIHRANASKIRGISVKKTGSFKCLMRLLWQLKLLEPGAYSTSSRRANNVDYLNPRDKIFLA